MPPLRSTGQSPEAERPEYAGQYRLESCLGTGGMGIVHLATSPSGLRLAVKVIHAEHSLDPEFRARFRQEVTAARRVSGAFTAPVVDADPEAARPWMATLYIEGPTLAARVKRNPLDGAELRRVGAGLAEALRDIHRAGLVHRDLKPSNVLLAPDGPKVIDFGISRPTDSDLRTETGKLIGTPPFMAPEQFQRPREVGPEADVFAMGSVLVHAATGRGPFDSDSPYIVAYQVVHDEPNLTGVPTDLAPLFRRCLDKDPAERPTPYEVMVALRESTPSSSYDTQAYIPEPRIPDRRESVAGWAGTDTGAAAGGGGYAGAQGVSGEPEVLENNGFSGVGGAVHASEPAHASRATGAFGAAGVLGAAGASAPGASPPAKHGRRWALMGTALALLTAVVAGTAVLRASDDNPRDVRNGPAAQASDRAPRDWAIPLHRGNAENKTPGCAADPRLPALYCTAPGVKAARLDPATGETLWSLPARGRPAQGTGESTTPVAVGGLVHVTTPGTGTLEALDPRSGAVRWTLSTSSYSSVRHAGNIVLLIGRHGRVRAVDAATGEERWTRQLGGLGTEWLASPGVDGPALAATPSPGGGSTRVTAVDPASGDTLWERRQPGYLRPVWTSRGAAHLIAEDRDGYATAIVRMDMADQGRGARRIPLGTPVDQAQAAVRGNVLYLTGHGGALLAVDTGRAGSAPPRGDRAVLWRLETAQTNLSRPAADARAVYVAAGDGRLLVVDAARGRLAGQTSPRMDNDRHTYAPWLPTPVVVEAAGEGRGGGRVYGAAPDGSVFGATAADLCKGCAR
ncbi:serine/threonine-protein kinase [Streptomyces sp. NPDC057638]|uniref:serine/threonine-protein kinase n=1 Tax=Streptomyces sp. NPDC057638 TaxID=3346190 RepID=UPI0036738E79